MSPWWTAHVSLLGLTTPEKKVSWQLYATNPEHWRVRPKAARMQMKNCWSAVDTCGEGWSKVRIGCFVFWNVFLRKILSERKTLRCSTPPRDSSCSFMDLQESLVLMTVKESQNSRHRTQLSNNLTVLRAAEEVRRGSFRLAIFWKAWNVVIECAIKWCERRKINQVAEKSKSKQRKVTNS